MMKCSKREVLCEVNATARKLIALVLSMSFMLGCAAVALSHEGSIPTRLAPQADQAATALHDYLAHYLRLDEELSGRGGPIELS